MVNVNIPMLGAIIFPNLGGWTAAFIAVRNKNVLDWYDEELKKPSWCPPNWIFTPMRTILYCCTGYASYLVWRDGGGFNGEAQYPLMLYTTQLAFNWVWTPLFFGMNRLGTALLDVLMLTATAGLTSLAFYKINEIAGYIMVPYMLWLTVASALNYCIWRDNKRDKKQE